MSRISGLALVASAKALDAAGLAPSPAEPTEEGAVLFTSTHGATGYLNEFHEGYLTEGSLGASPILFTNGVSNAPAGHISLEYGIRGRCVTIIGGPLSPLEALSEAAALLHGPARWVLICAAEEWSEVMERAYRDCSVPEPSGLIVPDKSRPICEGAAALVVDGAPGGLTVHPPGFGSGTDASSNLVSAVDHALCAAGLDEGEVDLVVSTLPMEGSTWEAFEGLSKALGRGEKEIALACPVAGLGEGFSYTTLLGSVAALEIVSGGVVPPLPNVTRGKIPSWLYAPRNPSKRDIRSAIVVARGPNLSAGAVAVTRNP
jgi:3-oxoacyl-[acyl-carrier-protein] synthase II